MTDISNLLFKREHFPIPLNETQEESGRKKYSIDKIVIPPYHPSMIEGIPFEFVPDLVDTVIEETAKDLRDVLTALPSYFQRVFKDLEYKIKTGDIKNKHTIYQDEKGIVVCSVPIVHQVCIGRKIINPNTYYGDSGERGIAISPKLAYNYFRVPISVEFSPELMEEYDMKETKQWKTKRIKCPYLWWSHNFDYHFDAIFYKNLVIALDNAVVKKKIF